MLAGFDNSSISAGSNASNAALVGRRAVNAPDNETRALANEHSYQQGKLGHGGNFTCATKNRTQSR